jgi:hypothetical protein
MVAPVRSRSCAKLHATFAAAGASSTPWSRRNLSPACVAWWRAPAGRWSIGCRPKFQPSRLVAQPFEPAILYEVGVFHRRDREPSMLAAAFLELLEGKLGG